MKCAGTITMLKFDQIFVIFCFTNKHSRLCFVFHISEVLLHILIPFLLFARVRVQPLILVILTMMDIIIIIIIIIRIIFIFQGFVASQKEVRFRVDRQFFQYIFEYKD